MGLWHLFLLLFGRLGGRGLRLTFLLGLLALFEGCFDKFEGEDLVGELLVDEREGAELRLGIGAVLFAQVDLVDLSAIGFHAQPAADYLVRVDLEVSDSFTMSSKYASWTAVSVRLYGRFCEPLRFSTGGSEQYHISRGCVFWPP